VTRRIPIVATLVVLSAVVTMVWLGIWQLHRKEWKEALIARYERAEQAPAPVPWPSGPAEYEAALFHRSQLDCAAVTGMGAIAGRSARDEAGWSHIAHCDLAGGGKADVALGWSNNPAPVTWRGGPVTGWVTGSSEQLRLVASPPQAGLAQLARPDPGAVSTTPTGHLFYALQWFAFAAIALVIYGLVLRKRWRGYTSTT
jgi:surfeit locus 1 family protein